MIYRYYSDVGGWRLVVLFHQGRKWIKLLDYSTLKVYRCPVKELDTLRPCSLKPVSLARKIASRKASYKRLGITFPKKAVLAAINALRKGSI